jgi:cytochrome c-type biogenesis protein CcmH/NrfF
MALADTPTKPTLDSLGNQVQCTCGCVAPLNQCPMVNCAEKSEVRAFIATEIAGGKDETTILQDLSLKYGVQVLTAPPARGFNLAVWILPGVGLLIGLGIVVMIVRRWKGKRVVTPEAPPAPYDPKLLSAVEEEIKSTGMR